MVAPLKRKRDKFQAYYTNSRCITSYMVGLLNCSSDMSLLEPSGGEGVFIDELLAEGVLPIITVYEINNKAVEKLRKKYQKFNNITIYKGDFLLENISEKFDRIIANPPYGAYQSKEKRKLLKKYYPNIYTKETYGLFLYKALRLLKSKGRLVFIIPDTYLTLHMHAGLRAEILSNYKIESIALFPSKFFPGISFGYSGLSIISIINEKVNPYYAFPVYNGLKKPEQLPQLLTDEKSTYEICRLSYKELFNNPSNSFFLPSKKWISDVIRFTDTTIGDICHVVTGFYSGNDAKYLRRAPHIRRGAKKYAVVNPKQICTDDLSRNPPLNGIASQKHWVPIVKGGNRRFYKPSEWYMDWSIDGVYNYKVMNKKKARFQNSQFYFKQGIAVPMVSSSSITASLIDGRLFDQSIVGIFPKRNYEHLLYYLLGFFNSNVCNDLIRTINLSTNNSANYIKKIPLIIPEDRLIDCINQEVDRLIELAKLKIIEDTDLSILNNIFDAIYKESHNRVRGSFSLPLPTPPGMRVRTRRFTKVTGP